MVDWLPDAKPDWWSDLTDFITNFGRLIRNPPRYIFALIIGLLLWIVDTISSGLSAAIEVFEGPAWAINAGLGTVGGTVGNALIGTVGTVNHTAINIAYGAGPLAPFGVFALWLAEMWVFYMAIMAAAPYVGALLGKLIGGR